jgi:hypothetical protein
MKPTGHQYYIFAAQLSEYQFPCVPLHRGYRKMGDITVSDFCFLRYNIYESAQSTAKDYSHRRRMVDLSFYKRSGILNFIE